MKTFGLTRKERLKKTGEFSLVLRGGRRTRGEFLTLASRQRSQGPHTFPRLGIIVPKRIYKRAHDRNRVKRWIREAFRSSKPRLKIGFDVVVSLAYAPEALDFHKVKDELEFLLKKADLIT